MFNDIGQGQQRPAPPEPVWMAHVKGARAESVKRKWAEAEKLGAAAEAKRARMYELCDEMREMEDSLRNARNNVIAAAADAKEASVGHGWAVHEAIVGAMDAEGRVMELRPVGMNRHWQDRDMTGYAYYTLSVQETSHGEEPLTPEGGPNFDSDTWSEWKFMERRVMSADDGMRGLDSDGGEAETASLSDSAIELD